MVEYELEKLVWSEADFEQMGWHDATIHAFAFAPESYELFLDIDYILQWINPTTTDGTYQFVIAPATLIFESVFDIIINIETQVGDCSLQGIERSAERLTPNGKFTEWEWILDTNEGTISFSATGFKQYFRQRPVLGKSQMFTLAERGGINFSRDFNA